jgi:hypothetical protein
MCFSIFGAVLVKVGHFEWFCGLAVRYILQGAVIRSGRTEK